MNESLEYWERAKESLEAAQEAAHRHPNSSASRSYYAAFEAVCALFSAQGHTFAKHTAVEAAVHRDLIHTGRWPAELGESYRRLMRLRNRGDYGGGPRVSPAEAEEAVALAQSIVEAVRNSQPDVFT